MDGPKFTIYQKVEASSSIGVEERKTRGNPGPGTYKPDYKKLVKSNGIFSLRTKPIIKEENRAPGPGAYHADIDSATKASPSWRFST